MPLDRPIKKSPAELQILKVKGAKRNSSAACILQCNRRAALQIAWADVMEAENHVHRQAKL